MQDQLWVFGYGSLIWDPGFEVAEARVAHLAGYRRSFCMRSLHYRGTPESPGLVLALEPQPGAHCTGLALRVPAGQEAAALAGLRARELISYAYQEAQVPLRFEGGGSVVALTYVINPENDQYQPGLTLPQQAQIIAGAQGQRGSNREYLSATYHHLTRLGIQDPDMAWLAAELAKT